MDPEEVEYIAENSFVSIIPTFNGPVMYFIVDDFGPFRAGLPLRVPLWMAVMLKNQHKCKIQPPDWMLIENLEALKENEKVSRTFTKMPSEHYMIEAKLLLGHATDDIPRADEVKTIIKDLWDIRMSKLRTSIDLLVKGSASHAAIDNLTLMEITSIRPILPHALDYLNRMKTDAKKLSATQLQNSTLGMSSSLSN